MDAPTCILTSTISNEGTTRLLVAARFIAPLREPDGPVMGKWTVQSVEGSRISGCDVQPGTEQASLDGVSSGHCTTSGQISIGNTPGSGGHLHRSLDGLL
jgi:hypothetical protein